MAWAFHEAKKRGLVVRVVLRESETEALRELQYSLAYAGQTAARFKAMVKAEVTAYLAALNASVAEQDVTEDYRP